MKPRFIGDKSTSHKSYIPVNTSARETCEMGIYQQLPRLLSANRVTNTSAVAFVRQSRMTTRSRILTTLISERRTDLLSVKQCNHHEFGFVAPSRSVRAWLDRQQTRDYSPAQ